MVVWEEAHYTMAGIRSSASSGRVQMLAAFAAIYMIWGSTYLAIRFAIDTLPPFLMAGARFLIAGMLLLTWMKLRGAAWPKAIHWRAAAIMGGLLLVGGNGGVVLAEERVPSSVVAVLIALVPIWMTLFDWLRPRGEWPGAGVMAGVLLGFAGVAYLVGPALFASKGINPVGALIVVAASMSWAAGSLYGRTAAMPDSPQMGTSIEMLAGGALLVVLGTLTGEPAQLHLQTVSVPSLLGLAYLIIFGSLVAFSAYVWLLRHAAPAHVGTYAYVNPVVAVLLGWGLRGEQLTAHTLIAAAIIIASVAIITTFRGRASARAKARTAAMPAISTSTRE